MAESITARHDATVKDANGVLRVIHAGTPVPASLVGAYRQAVSEQSKDDKSKAEDAPEQDKAQSEPEVDKAQRAPEARKSRRPNKPE